MRSISFDQFGRPDEPSGHLDGRVANHPQDAGADRGGSALGSGAAPHPMNLRGPALTHAGSDGNWNALVCLFPQTGAGV